MKYFLHWELLRIINTIKLMAPVIYEISAMCREKIVKSTDEYEWYVNYDKGGYSCSSWTRI